MAVLVVEIKGRFPDDLIVYEDFIVSDHEITDIEAYVLAENIKAYIQREFDTDE